MSSRCSDRFLRKQGTRGALAKHSDQRSLMTGCGEPTLLTRVPESALKGKRWDPEYWDPRFVELVGELRDGPFPLVSLGDAEPFLTYGAIVVGQKRPQLDEGVLYVPGECCYGPDPRREVERNHMRLTFGTVRPAEIDEGVARLSRAIHRAARQGRPSERTP